MSCSCSAMLYVGGNFADGDWWIVRHMSRSVDC